jgi:hypothetical protein
MKSSRFGYRVLETKTLDQSCPSCGKHTLELNIVGRYVSFFYIPMTGTGKKASVFCSNCEEIYNGSRIPHQVTEQADSLKKTAKRPIWFFTGLIILGAGIIVKLIFRFL